MELSMVGVQKKTGRNTEPMTYQAHLLSIQRILWIQMVLIGWGMS